MEHRQQFLGIRARTSAYLTFEQSHPFQDLLDKVMSEDSNAALFDATSSLVN